jgi:hypothetical protein
VSDTGTRPTAAQLADMRDWLADCAWRDMSAEDLEDHELVPDEHVLKAVRKTYTGGIDQFIQDMA